MKNFSVHKALPTYITDITNITMKNFSFYTLKTYILIMKNFSNIKLINFKAIFKLVQTRKILHMYLYLKI